MKDATVPLANGREEDASVKTKERPADIPVNGTSSPPPAMTNGHTDEVPSAEQIEMNIDAEENALLQGSDGSDYENLVLELSDEDGAGSGAESSASTVVLLSSVARPMEAEKSEAAPADVARLPLTSAEVAEKRADEEKSNEAEKPVAEESQSAGSVDRVLDGEEPVPSPDCVLLDESEPVVDPKSSTNGSSDAATDDVSKPGDACSAGELTYKAKEVSCDVDSCDAIAVRTGDSDVVKDIDCIVLDDDSVDEKDLLNEGNGSQLTKSEAAKVQVAEGAEGADNGLSSKPEVQVIDIDDSSSESSNEKSEIAADVAESDEVSKKSEVEACNNVESDGLELKPSASLREAAQEGEEVAGKELLECPKVDVGEGEESTLAGSDETPEIEATKEELVAVNGDLGADTLLIGNADDELDKLDVKKADDLADKLAAKDTTPASLASELAGDPDDKSGADKPEDVEKRSSENEESVIDAQSTEKDETVVDAQSIEKQENVVSTQSSGKEENVVVTQFPEKDKNIIVTEFPEKAGNVDTQSSENKEKLDTQSSDKADNIDEQSPGAEENAVNDLVSENTDEGVLALPLETLVEPAPTSDSEVSGKEVVGKDEEKVEPTLTAAEVVALTLDKLVAYVVNKSEGSEDALVDKDKPTEDVKQSQDISKIDDQEVISIGDDSSQSSEGTPLSDVDKVENEAIAEANSKDVKDVKLSSDSAHPTVTAGSSDFTNERDSKAENESDCNPLGASETDSKTLLQVAPKPSAETITTVSEDPPRRPKRSTVQKSEEIALAKKMKLSNGVDSPSVRSISKENLNPAQKRGTAASTNEDAKKARLESLRERKPKKRKEMMSNLDRAIARVASGGMSVREQEIVKLVQQLATKSMERITVTQLEELIQYKIGQFILEQSDCAAYRKEVAHLRGEVEKWQTVAKSMSKQVKDLENVMKKMVTDMKTLNKDALPIPAKVNRSVGLQVGDGKITNEQKKLALPRPMPPTAPPPVVPRRSGIMTNRPSPMATSANVAQPRLRAPPPIVTPPKRVVPVGAPTLSPAHRPGNVLLPSNTPPKSGVPLLTAPTLVAAGLGRRPAVPAVARTPPGALIDLTEGDELTVPRQFVPATAIRQVAPKIRVVNSVPSITATKPQGTIRLVAQNTLTGQPSARMAYMVPASATGGEPRMYFAASAPKQQVSMNGGTVVTRPAAAQPRQVVFSTNVSQGSQALRGLTPGFRQTTFVASNRPAPGSVARARALHAERKMSHPAPLPPSPASPTPGPGWKRPPPVPEVKISMCDKRSRSGGDRGIILSWKMDALCSENDDIKSYQLYAYQETSGEPSTSMWKKVGEVLAMALPMACTLTQFTEGNKYHFAVRAVDVRGRTGPFSKPGSILLSSALDD